MKTHLNKLLSTLFVWALASISLAVEVPALSGRVNDYANLIPDTEQAVIETKLKELEDATTAQVVILTVLDADGDIDSFSIEVAREWQLGQKDKDNGLLITYAVEDDVYRIETGFGLEGAIPDSIAGDIIRNNLRTAADPKNGTSNFAAGFNSAVQAISDIITAEYAKDPTGASMRGSDGDRVLAFIGIAFVIAGLFGFAHPIAGGVVGAIEGAGIAALLFSAAVPLILVAGAVGFGAGLIAKFVLEAALTSSGTGGSYGGSGRSNGGFRGGGGGFGGGGARG